MSFDRDRVGWPIAELPQALTAVAHRYGLQVSESGADTATHDAVPDRWIPHCAARLQLEALPVQAAKE